MPSALLSIDGLTARYGGIEAVRGVDLRVGEGEVVALLGPNGAGKSTLLRCIAGLMRPSGGQIGFDGHDLRRLGPHQISALGLALVPEGRGMFGDLTVGESLTMGAYLCSSSHERASRQESVLEIFPALADRLGQRCGSLSGGEQQQVAIARALMSKPRLLLIDELSLGLAPVIVQRLYAMLADINRQGVTLVIVEQHVKLALRLASRAYVLEKGEVVLQGTSEKVAREPLLRDTYVVASAQTGDPAAAPDRGLETLEKILVPLRVSSKRRLQEIAARRGDGRVGPLVARAIERYIAEEEAAPAKRAPRARRTVREGGK